MAITHFKRLLQELTPTMIHVLSEGRVVATGGPELSEILERDGYEPFRATVRLTTTFVRAKVKLDGWLTEATALLGALQRDLRAPNDGPSPTRVDSWRWATPSIARRARRRSAVAADAEDAPGSSPASSVIVLIVGVLGGGYLYANWRFDAIPKIHVLDDHVPRARTALQHPRDRFGLARRTDRRASRDRPARAPTRSAGNAVT